MFSRLSDIKIEIIGIEVSRLIKIGLETAEIFARSSLKVDSGGI